MLSLEKKLPLLIAGLAMLVLVSTAAIAVREVRRSAALLAEQRLERVNRELGELVARGLENRLQLFDSLAAHPAVQGLLRGSGERDAAERALERLRVATDSGAPIQLLDSARRVVVQINGRSVLPPSGERVPGAATELGAFEADEERTYYWMERPLPGNGAPAGWIRQQRRAGSRAAAESVGELIEPGIEIYFVHRAGGTWAALSGEPLEGPATLPTAGTAQLSIEGEDRLARLDTLPGMSWAMVSTMPLDAVQARSTALLRKLLGVGAVLLLLAGLAAWAISRRVTAPLRELGRAADGIARGDYSVRARVSSTDELGRLAESFNEMAARIEAARIELELTSQAKSEFLATMSHEVRTPINAVLGYADLLDAGTAGELSPRQKMFVARIRESSRHLTNVVDEVLDFSKIEAGGMGLRVQVVSAAEALRSAAALISAQAEAKQQALHVDPESDCTVLVDPHRLRQVLMNLLSNAVKFTPAGGTIEAGCTTEGAPPGLSPRAEARGWVALSIRDSGPGIAPDQQERIFEPFVQASGGYTREHGGTGLGLAISRRLARLMGGEITVASESGAGAVFTVWLPQVSADHSSP